MDRKAVAQSLMWSMAFAVLLLVSGVWLLLAFRVLSVPILAAMVAIFLVGRRGNKIRRIAITWVIFMASTLYPADITFRNVPGPPRFVPKVYGLPSRDTAAAARRGEVVLGGCVVSGLGLEPRVVWVW